MEHFHKDDYDRVSRKDAEAILKAHNCLRDGWGDCDVYWAYWGAKRTEIIVRELSTGRWFVPKKSRP